MLNTTTQLMLFFAKGLIIVIFTLLLLAGILALLGRGKEKSSGKISIKNLNKKYAKIKEILLAEILPKKSFKKYLKNQKANNKTEAALAEKSPRKNIFVLRFDGDIKASAVTALRQEVTAILDIAKSGDEVVVCLESTGGMVHSYGLAAAQLSRLRKKQIPLTVAIDKVAASGGYLMACIANKILAAPFALVGSIGVIVQLPNFNRLLKERHIDFEQITAGHYKRTLTLFGENTQEGREKLREEVEDIHQSFKQLIQQYRPQVDIQQVSSGEVWLGSKALELRLVDELTTSDDYLLSHYLNANLFEIKYQFKKSVGEKLLTSGVELLWGNHAIR